MLNNSLVQTNNSNKGARTISQYLAGDNVQKMLVSSLGGEKEKQKFVSNIISAVSVKPQLQECEFSTVVSSGLLATSLNLSLSPSLGLAYLVPFKDTKNDRTVATFILGYRGYIQLAIRSGYYADLDCIEIRQGEYLGKDNITGKPKFKFIENDEERDKLPIIGYLAYFEYLNGFKKTLYWTKEKMAAHADRYSPAFSLEATKGKYPKVSFADYEAGNYPKEDEWKYSSFWYVDFDSMAKKTLIRQLISKWGIMSIDMQTADEIDTRAMENETEELPEDVFKDNFFGNTEGLLSDNIESVETEEAALPKRGRKKEIIEENISEV